MYRRVSDRSLRTEDLPAGGSQCVTVDGKEVALFNVEGSLYAVGNRCPHRSGPLVRGRVETVPETGEPAIRCPIHGWLFDLKTGRCFTRAGASIPTYPVLSVEGKISIVV